MRVRACVYRTWWPSWASVLSVSVSLSPSLLEAVYERKSIEIGVRRRMEEHGRTNGS